MVPFALFNVNNRRTVASKFDPSQCQMTTRLGFHMSVSVCLSGCCCGAPLLKMIGIYGIFDSHHECNICKKSFSVGIETLLKALNAADRRTISRSVPRSKNEIALFYFSLTAAHFADGPQDLVPAMLLGDSQPAARSAFKRASVVAVQATPCP